MAAACVRRVIAVLLAVMVVAPLAAHSPSPVVRVDHDAARGEIVVTVGPIDIPASAHYHHHPSEERAKVRWPADGWLRGYRIDVVDAEGWLLPREMLHHAGVANLARRQLAYPLVERIAAVGRETAPVMLPESMGVPLSAGQDLLVYYALVNPSGTDVRGASLKLTITWTSPRPNQPTSVFPLFLDANPQPGGGSRVFDLPPGVSVTRADVTLPAGGHLRALGAHLHDHAVEIRLEDVATGKILARLKTRRDADGRVIAVASTRFVWKRRGLRLNAGHPYRVVAIYNNPTRETISGAMAFLAGPFVPDDVGQWPAIDPTDAAYQYDLSTVLGPPAHVGHRHGGGRP